MDTTEKLPIFSLTHDAYAKAVRERLGRGHDHAILLYKELFQSGYLEGRSPAFANAGRLLEEMVAITHWPLLPITKECSEGETKKFLIKTYDGLEVESVLVPMQAGGTLCISSQVGCRMGCTFCETGRMGLLRNLSVEEIVSQVFAARHRQGMRIRNLVFMGMGEPFDNYETVIEATRVLQDPMGCAFGKRQITISTSGSIPGIERLMEEKDAPNLAVSLNAPNNQIRNRLMPINRTHPMESLYETMRLYGEKTKREIFIAYVLIEEENDSLAHADELANYLEGLNVKINLIPYNAQSRDRFKKPADEAMSSFATRLRQHGYYTLFRQTKGPSIMAACGQLGNLQLRRQFLSKEKTQLT